MITTAKDFRLLCFVCYEREKSFGDTHIHAVAAGKGVFLRFTCFKCGTQNEGIAMALEPKNREEVSRGKES